MNRAVAVLLALSLVSCSAPAPPENPELLAQSAPFIGFMETALLQPTGIADGLALAETADELGEERWFWTDDNAKALELFALPALNRAHPKTARALLEFVERMSTGGQIYRRAGLPQLMIQSVDPTALELSAGFLNLRGNLRQDALTLSMRYHDGRTQNVMQLGGHRAQFSSASGAHELIASTGLETTQVIVRPDALRLVLRASLNDSSTTPPTRRARIWVRYDFVLGQPWFTRSVDFKVFEAGGAQAVTLDLGLSNLDTMAARYSQLCVGGVCSGTDQPSDTVASADANYSVADRDSMSFSYALEVQPPLLPKRLRSSVQSGALTALAVRYELGDFRQGEKKSVREKILLSNGQLHSGAGGGFANLPAVAGIDSSISYDYGAELNAVACFRWQAAPAADQARLRAWFDRHYAQFKSAAQRTPSGALRSPVMTRGLSFVVLGLDCMARAEPNSHYADELATMRTLLLTLQYTERDDLRLGVFDGGAVAGVYLDTHAAAMLALARSTLRRDAEPAVHDALRLALAALNSGPDGAWLPASGSDPGVRTNDQWSYSAGLLARAMASVELSAARGHLALSDQELEKVAALKADARARIRSAFKAHARGMEILTQPNASEGNSETQPWALLGLLDFDAALIAPDEPSPRH